MTDNRPFLALCLPCQDLVRTEFALSLAAVAAFTNSFRLVIIQGSSSIVTTSRNMCVERLETTEAMINHRIEWTMWFDSDIQFPPQTISRLVAHDLEIVGAAYPRRTAPYDVMVRRIDNQPIHQDSGVVEVEALPMGCMLIRRDVFLGIKPPIFRLDYVNGQTMSEDLVFCREARARGRRVHCDLDLTREIAHIGTYAYRASEPMSEQQALSDAA